MPWSVPYGDNGHHVRFSSKINCPTHLLPGGDNWEMLEEALKEITTEEVFGGFTVTIDDLSYATPLTVIENTNRDRVFWAVYRGHKFYDPKPSPFIDTQDAWPETSSLTLYFNNGFLAQVTPGEDEVPPLPWMASAETFKGGVDACINFWRNHSLLYSRNNTLPLSRSFEPPPWWLRQAA